VGGIRVAGEPTRAALPIPPVVGQCLVDTVHVVPVDVDGRPIEDHGGAVANGPGIGVFGPPRAPFGPCVTGADEEVAAVSSIVGPVGDHATIAGADRGGCRAGALHYAGLVPADRGYTLPGPAGLEPIAWSFSIDVDAKWFIPSPVLRSAGQTWAACVVTDPDGRPYPGTIRSAFSGGILPARFGTCWRSEQLSVGVDYVDCGTAHRSELIATGSVVQSAWVDFDEMVASCGQIAARAMGRADPTLTGELRLATSPGADMWNRANRRSSSAVCYVTSATDRQLSGTLIGIGDGPIPWAG
jgi:hypothetical protein